MGLEVIGKSNEAIRHINDFDNFVGIVNNSIRKKVQESLDVKGARIPKFIHNNATL